MINDSFISSPTRFGAAGGVITLLFINIQLGDIIKTILLAVIGAVVSFLISLLLKMLLKKWKHK